MFTTLLRGPKGLIGSAALVALSLGTPALAQEQLSIATGGTGGVYYPMGGGLAEIINGHVDGYSATAEVTGASVENMGLIATGDADFAIGLADTVAQAHSGTGRFDGQQLSMVRGVASLYANMVHIVALEGSGITALEDLRGKRVSIGAPGSGTEVNTSAILEANGITYDDIEEQRLNFNETADALANGDIDAGFLSVGAPTSSILNLSTTQDIVLIALTEDELAAALDANATFAKTTLVGGTYTGVDEDLTVLVGAHRAGVDVDVGIHLDVGDADPPRLQQAADGRRRQPLSERGEHPAGHEDELLTHVPRSSTATALAKGGGD